MLPSELPPLEVGKGSVRFALPLPPYKGEVMDYEKKMERIASHLEEHPQDYQSVIALVKANSDAISQRRREIAHSKARKVAEVRAERRARHEESAQ